MNVSFLEFGLYARAQDDMSEGVFDYNNQSSYDILIQCTDTKDPMLQTVTVSIIQPSQPNTDSDSG